MTKFTFTAPHEGAVRYEASADGKARLKAWVKESAFAGDGAVWLIDYHAPLVAIRLALPEAVIEDANNWSGEAFSHAGPGVLEIEVEAASPQAAYDLLAESLFRFGGESAAFPVYVSREAAGTLRAASASWREVVEKLEGGQRRHGRVLVQSIDLSLKAAGDGVTLEYLTVSVPRELGLKATSWREE